MSQNQTEGNVVGVQASQPSENKTLILALSAIILSILLTALDQTVVNPAMPRIVEELQGFSLFAWVTTAYLLTSTAIIPIAGKLGDIFGRKPLLVIAVLMFMIGSALSGAAPSMFWLVVFRGLQGIGAGALQANAFAMIAELFPDSAKRARWQGFIAGVFGLASVIGPALGGFITDNLAWRWVFYVNLPVGVLAIPALIFYLPYTKSNLKRSIDWWGAVTITGAVVSLLLALTWGGQPEPRGYAWDSPQIIGLLISTLVLTVLFLWIETRATEPIVPLKLFRLKAIRSVTIISFGMGAVMLGALLFIPLFVQVIQGQSASSSGAITTPLALAMVTANILTGQFIGRIGILKLPMISGSIIMIIGIGLLTLLDVASPPWEVTLFMIVIGLGMGQVMPSMTIAVQETVPRRDLGAGISSVQFFRSIGSTVGVALIGTIVTNSYVTNINNTPGVQSAPPRLLEAIQEPQNLINKQIAAIMPPELVGAVHQALDTAIHNGFLIALGVSVVILLASFTLPSIRVTSGLKPKATRTAESVSEVVVSSAEGTAPPAR
jgi:EmrB/QacA subfamily drug resistance transporter